MLKGDASWSTKKRILGWDLDTRASTLTLPPHRLDRLYELLELISPPKRRVPVKRWHLLLGELRSMSPTLPGARGLFSILQDSLGKADRNRARITNEVWHMAANFRAIADSLRARPTRLRELVPSHPSHVGACDACILGMGGVWFPEGDHTPTLPILWRQPFSSKVQQALITAQNPHGSFSISDLELAALIAHKDIIASHHPVAERTIWMATDNRAELSWSDAGSATSTACSRAYLLRFNSLHQRVHRYVASHNHIPGKASVMADNASRLWHLTDAELLAHFATFYPQASPWQLSTLAPDTNLALTDALLFKQQPAREFLGNVSALPAPLGRSGPPFVRASPSTPSTSRATPSPFSKRSLNACAAAHCPPAVDPCDLAQWKTPSEQWARRMPGWGPRTLA